MKFNWPFRRKTEDILPTEVEDYYKAEKRERAGLAWLLALGTLLITVALALGVFFGGRYLYRKVVNKPADTTPATTQTTSEPTPLPQGSTQPQTTNPQPSTNTVQPQTTPPTSTPTPSTSTPVTNQPIPNTGPADTLAIFVATVLIATFAHRFYTTHKL